MYDTISLRNEHPMMNLKVGVTKNPRFEPLIDGSVKSAKADLNIHVTTPPELFFKNLKND